MGLESVAIPGIPSSTRSPLAQKAEKAFGKPSSPTAQASLEQAAADGILTYKEIQGVYGLTEGQINGLRALDVIMSDGVDESELDNIIACKDKARANFVMLFQGVGMEETKINTLFDEIWDLSLNGEFELKKWNELMERYGLNDYEMNSNSFEALLGGGNGKQYSQDGVVEDVTELGSALKSLIATMRLNIPLTGNEEVDSKRAKQYALVFMRYCGAKSFNIIYLKDFGRAVEQALRLIAARTTDETAKSETESSLQSLISSPEEWNKFLVVLLANLEEALGQGLSGDTAPRVMTKRMKVINDILANGPTDPKWAALVEQLGNLSKGLIFNYEKVEKGELVGSGDKGKVDVESGSKKEAGVNNKEGGTEPWALALPRA